MSDVRYKDSTLPHWPLNSAHGVCLDIIQVFQVAYVPNMICAQAESSGVVVNSCTESAKGPGFNSWRSHFEFFDH